MSETKPKDYDLWPNSDHELFAKERLTTRYDDMLDHIMTELDGPLRLHANFPTADAKVYFKETGFTLASGAKRELSPLNDQIFTIAASSVDFQTQATTGATFVVTWPVTNTVGQFRKVGFTLTSAGEIEIVFSTQEATIGAIDPGVLFVDGIPLGYIDLECTDSAGKWKSDSAGTNVILNNDIHRFASSGGGGGGGAAYVEKSVNISSSTTGTLVTGISGQPDIIARFWDDTLKEWNEIGTASLNLNISPTGNSID